MARWREGRVQSVRPSVLPQGSTDGCDDLIRDGDECGGLAGRDLRKVGRFRLQGHR